MKKEHFEIILEDIDSKFDLVLEGLQGLRNDMGRMEERLYSKIDLNTDLKAHRADTEIHHGVYRVKEKAEG